MEDVDRVMVDLSLLTVPVASPSSDAGHVDPGRSLAYLGQGEPIDPLDGVKVVKRLIGCVTVEDRQAVAA